MACPLAKALELRSSGRSLGPEFDLTSRRQGWADWIKKVDAERDVFAYFNNDDNAYAVKAAMARKGWPAG